jgi:hypothetical protein
MDAAVVFSGAMMASAWRLMEGRKRADPGGGNL